MERVFLITNALETSGGANDRRTAIDVQVIGSSMEQSGTVSGWITAACVPVQRRKEMATFTCLKS